MSCDAADGSGGVSEIAGSVGGEEEVPSGAETEGEDGWSGGSHHHHRSRYSLHHLESNRESLFKITLSQHYEVLLLYLHAVKFQETKINLHTTIHLKIYSNILLFYLFLYHIMCFHSYSEARVGVG